MEEHTIFLSFSKDEMFTQVIKRSENEENFKIRTLKTISKVIKKMKIIEFDLEMNLVLISSGNNKFYLIDFEFAKVHAVINFDTDLKIKRINML